MLSCAVAYACDVCGNFETKFFQGRKNVKNGKNIIFLKNGKNNKNCHNGTRKPGKFSRSRMTKRTTPFDSSREI